MRMIVGVFEHTVGQERLKIILTAIKVWRAFIMTALITSSTELHVRALDSIVKRLFYEGLSVTSIKFPENILSVKDQRLKECE